MELIDLVNSIIFFSISNDLRWLTFLLESLTVTLKVLLLWICSSFDASICFTMAFPPLGNSDHIVVSVSIDFPINSKQGTPFHRIAYDYSCADGMVFMVIWEMFHGRISSNSVLLLLLVNFVSRFRSELTYISLIVSIRSNLTYLLGFQQPGLLS